MGDCAWGEGCLLEIGLAVHVILYVWYFLWPGFWGGEGRVVGAEERLEVRKIIYLHNCLRNAMSHCIPLERCTWCATSVGAWGCAFLRRPCACGFPPVCLSLCVCGG